VAVADALYVGETERLFREVALAGVLEAAAHALRSGRGLIGDGAADLMREIRHNYPNAGLGGGEADQSTTLGPKFAISMDPFLGLNFRIAGRPWTVATHGS